MTRILFWCDAFWPLIGGVEVLAARLVVALEARGHEIEVIADRHANLDANSVFHGIRIHRLPFIDAITSRKMDEWLAVRQQVASIKREFRPDIVWVYHINLDVLAHLMTQAAHPAATLCTVHGAFPDNTVAPETAFGRALRSADWITACSGHALGETRRQVPEMVDRSSAIWNGLEMPDLAPAPLDFDTPLLLCIGRMGSVEEKGFDIALEAMLSVLERAPTARLRIAGDGPARVELEARAAELGVADHVDFLGWVHPDLVLSLINEATVLLMPSRVPEGFGLVALQASQMARPVVATRVGGVAEVVDDGVTGLLVEPQNAPALARAIIQLLHDPMLATRMGNAGRKRAGERFSFARYVDSYDELLGRLVPGSLAAGAV